MGKVLEIIKHNPFILQTNKAEAKSSWPDTEKLMKGLVLLLICYEAIFEIDLISYLNHSGFQT